ncbi:MAG: PD-(D/E)XK nuclease family protein [Clostridia bacterium]|nr:PD-(D/E)XK nuclease family protein [Clostridia bacterium]
MLQFVYGCPGGGKSRFIFETIAKRSREGARVILLVPERFSLTAEQQICALCDKEEMLRVEVLSFKRLCNRVFREYGGLCYNYAGIGGQTLIAYRALCGVKDRLRNFSSLKLSDYATVSAIHGGLVNLRRAGVSFNTLYDLAKGEDGDPLQGKTKLKEKLHDLALIGMEYDRLLSEKYDDPERDLERLLALLDKHPFFADKEVFVDATSAFSKQELEVLFRVLLQGAPLTVALQKRERDDRRMLKRIDYCKNALVDLARRLNMPYRTLAECDHPYLKEAEDLLHLERNLYALEERPFEGCAEHIVLERCASPYEECKQIAARVLKDVSECGGRFKDHAVVVRTMDEYEGILRGVLEANGIPYTLSSPVCLSGRGGARVLLTALDLFCRRGRFEDLRSYLKSGYCGLTDEECFLLEDYANLWHIEGMRWFSDRPFTMNPNGHTTERDEETAERLLQINETRSKLIAPLLPLFAGLSSGTRACDFASALYEYALTLGLPTALKEKAAKAIGEGQGQQAQWHLATFKEICAALDELCYSFGDEPLTCEQFALALRALFDSRELGSIPGGQDRVLLSDAFNLKPGDVRCLYIAGMNDGVFPAPPASPVMFGYGELEALAKVGVDLSKDADRAVFDEQYTAYAALTLPYEKLTVLCHQKDGKGRTSKPSELFLRLEEMFKDRQEQEEDLLYGRAICLEKALKNDGSIESSVLLACFEEENASLLSNLVNAPLVTTAEFLRPERTDALYGNGPLKVSKSRLETFINCPFSYTCKYLLRLKEDVTETAGANEIGTIFHTVFEDLINGAQKEGVSFGSLSDEQIEKRVKEITEQIGRDLTGEDEDEGAVMAQLLRRVKNAAVIFSENLRDEFEGSAFKPTFCELPFEEGRTKDSFSLPPLYSDGEHPVIINGIADRVDVYRTEDKVYVRVVDYKTGKMVFRRTDLEKGFNLQLLLYLRALRDCRDPEFLSLAGAKEGDLIVPAGVQYYMARKPSLSLEKAMEKEEIRSALAAGILRSGWLIEDEQMKEALGIPGLAFSQKDHERSGVEDLNATLDGLDDILSGIAGRMKAGDACATPEGASKGETGCKYCKMRPICRNIGMDEDEDTGKEG